MRMRIGLWEGGINIRAGSSPVSAGFFSCSDNAEHFCAQELITQTLAIVHRLITEFLEIVNMHFTRKQSPYETVVVRLTHSQIRVLGQARGDLRTEPVIIAILAPVAPDMLVVVDDDEGSGWMEAQITMR